MYENATVKHITLYNQYSLIKKHAYDHMPLLVHVLLSPYISLRQGAAKTSELFPATPK